MSEHACEHCGAPNAIWHADRYGAGARWLCADVTACWRRYRGRIDAQKE